MLEIAFMFSIAYGANFVNDIVLFSKSGSSSCLNFALCAVVFWLCKLIQ